MHIVASISYDIASLNDRSAFRGPGVGIQPGSLCGVLACRLSAKIFSFYDSCVLEKLSPPFELSLFAGKPVSLMV